MTAVPRRAALVLSAVIVPLAMIASGVGFFHPAVYRDAAWLVPQARGQDLVTLLACAGMVPALVVARRGSPRSQLVWLGLLGYLAYTYVGAAFAYSFNELFLLYVALFGLSVFALVFAFSGIDAAALASRFDRRTPRRGVVAFLLVVALMLCVLWLGQIVPVLATGEQPESLERSGGSLKYVFALDLGLVVPISLLAATWLWLRRDWGYVLAGLILIKATSMGLALLSMTAFSMKAGERADLGLFVPWIALTGLGLASSVWFFSHCHERPAAHTADPGGNR